MFHARAEYARRIGVLWSGEHLFEGTVETLELLRSKGRSIHSRSSQYPFDHLYRQTNRLRHKQQHQIPRRLQTKTHKHGHTCNGRTSHQSLLCTSTPHQFNQDEVFGSAYSAAIYISRILQLPADKKTVYVLGEAGIETELDSEHIPHIGGTDPSLNRTIEKEDYATIASGSALDQSVGVVLCGLDFHLNYLKLSLAFHYLQRGAIFLATNSDATLPSANALFPGAAACAAPLVASMGGKNPTSLGKPSQAMMEAIKGKFQFDKNRACMIGDRLDTDIKFGIEGGLGGTLCVLTGVTKGQKDWESGDTVPSVWVDKLADLREGA